MSAVAATHYAEQAEELARTVTAVGDQEGAPVSSLTMTLANAVWVLAQAVKELAEVKT